MGVVVDNTKFIVFASITGFAVLAYDLYIIFTEPSIQTTNRPKGFGSVVEGHGHGKGHGHAHGH
jgi:hypothetical protein|uniref:Uncharacterized protein n=1 Tax=viral metagenome TaxID=1070528 RepID=A0A6C0JZ82_9ZZZZ